MKKHPVLRNILIDLVCAGLALVLFALFHHVLPRQQQSLGIVISNPYQTEKDTGAGLSPDMDPGMMIASAGISDVSSLSASGRQNSGGRGGKGGGMNGKGGSALDEEADTYTGEESGTPVSEKFADRYTDTVIVTENSYSSPDISVTVTEETFGQATYYLADSHIKY